MCMYVRVYFYVFDDSALRFGNLPGSIIERTLEPVNQPNEATLASFVVFFFQSGNLPADFKEDVFSMMKALDGKTIRVGSLCSGSEIHSKLLSRFFALIGAMCGTTVKVDLVFACEIAPVSQINFCFCYD